MNAQFARKFTVVSNELPEPPYDEKTRVKGWRFQLDYERIETSDTWALASPDMRPWLLMIWLTGWRQMPAGSLTNDDQLIAARIGMDYRMFVAHRDILMRGWVLHSDNRLYHQVIVGQVQEYMEHCRREANRKKKYRDQKLAEEEKQRLNINVPRDSCGTPPDATLPEPEPEPEYKSKGAKAPSSAKPAGLADLLDKGAGSEEGGAVRTTDGRKQTGKERVAAICPHKEVIRLYHEILPELPAIIPSRWRGSQSEGYLRTRWKEDARHQSLEFWKRFFQTVRTSSRWMGENGINWKADLHWLIRRANFDKVLQHMVNASETANG